MPLNEPDRNVSLLQSAIFGKRKSIKKRSFQHILEQRKDLTEKNNQQWISAAKPKTAFNEPNTNK